MSRYQSDEEQLESLKEWWKTYGKMTVIAVIVAAIASFGWRYWQQSRMIEGNRASEIYEQILIAQHLNQPKRAEQFALVLFKNYSNSPYAKLGQLLVAKSEVQSGQLEDAKQKLLWVMQESSSSQIRQVARLRIARILIAQKKYEDALTLLNTVDNESYLGAVAALKGDIYSAQQKTDLAKKQYEQALLLLPKGNGIYTLTEMKLANL